VLAEIAIMPTIHKYALLREEEFSVLEDCYLKKNEFNDCSAVEVLKSLKVRFLLDAAFIFRCASSSLRFPGYVPKTV